MNEWFHLIEQVGRGRRGRVGGEETLQESTAHSWQTRAQDRVPQAGRPAGGTVKHLKRPESLSRDPD